MAQPTIVAFREALESPADHFRTIRSAVPVRHEGGIAVARTAFFAESVVRFEGKRWLVCMPLTRSAVMAVERMAEKLKYIAGKWLCEYRVLYREMRFEDELGRKRECDIVLQEYPEGEVFGRDCSYPPTQLRAMLDLLHGEMESIGFTHNNLKPSNIIIGDDGRMHPVRYHYAELGKGCRDDFSSLYVLIADEEYGNALNDVSASYSAESGKNIGGGFCGFRLTKGCFASSRTTATAMPTSVGTHSSSRFTFGRTTLPKGGLWSRPSAVWGLSTSRGARLYPPSTTTCATTCTAASRRAAKTGRGSFSAMTDI